MVITFFHHFKRVDVMRKVIIEILLTVNIVFLGLVAFYTLKKPVP